MVELHGGGGVEGGEKGQETNLDFKMDKYL